MSLEIVQESNVDVEFRRWCIERAMQWPIIARGIPNPKDDCADAIVKRAEKIRAWVKAG